MLLTEGTLVGGLPERFRSLEEGMYFPNRYLENNARMLRYDRIATQTTPLDLVLRRLKDLIFFNCAGRNFSLSDNAGDFLGAIDTGKNPELKNCIALVLVKDPTSNPNDSTPKFILSIPGGFSSIDESMESTIGREGFEETGAKNTSNFVIIGEQSTHERDSRYNVISTSAACVVDKSELKARDDAKEIIIVPLLDEYGRLNSSYFKAGTYTDATGKEFSHQGLRADHDMVINEAYHWWRLNGLSKGWSFDEALKNLSIGSQQEAFKKFIAHPPGTDNYELRYFESVGNILLTPNVKFALEKSIEILQAAGVVNPETKAAKFVYELIEYDLLPKFPQKATTVHCLIAEDDNLVVFQREDRTLALPGKYYSPEMNENYHERYNFSPNLVTFAAQVARDEFDTDFRATALVANASLGDQPDEPYPSFSYVYAGVHTNAQHPRVGMGLSEGSRIIRIPIWKDKTKRILSKEIRDGIDGHGWAYNHGNRIIEGYFRDFIAENDNNGRMTAEQTLREKQLYI